MKERKQNYINSLNGEEPYMQDAEANGIGMRELHNRLNNKIFVPDKNTRENNRGIIGIYYKAARERLRPAGNYILRLLYPPRCPVCDALMGIKEYGCCQRCSDILPWVSGAKCMKCGRQLGDSRREYCDDCRKVRHFFDEGAAVFTYAGRIRDSVYRMKFQNRRDYIPFFAGTMVQVLAGHLVQWRPEVILPVPMHIHKRRRRGYNQSELLAEEVARLTGIPLKKDVLRCVRLTKDQKKLDRCARRKNLHGSFAVGERSLGFRRVLLVDDVYTTGSTVDELSRELKRHGVQQVYFVVLCIGKEKKAVCTA